MPLKNNVTLAEALNRMVDELKLKPRINESRVKMRWKDLMGLTIARHTQSLSLKKGKLYVKVSSASLKQELHYSRDKIKEIFNKEFNEQVVAEVVIYWYLLKFHSTLHPLFFCGILPLNVSVLIRYIRCNEF